MAALAGLLAVALLAAGSGEPGAPRPAPREGSPPAVVAPAPSPAPLALAGVHQASSDPALRRPLQVDWSTGGWSPHGAWRTLEVPGYRLHYPAPAEAWARHLAALLPAIRARVATSVGWDAAGPVDVVLADPLARPNGAAWPLLGRPRLVLLLTPPAASSALGGFVDWPTLLVTHEQVHLAHLLRPSRQSLRRHLGLPVGPIALAAPRWVVEGYATLLEGQLTGSGRPASAYRAAVLRRWAARGSLPGYAALAADSRHYLGSSWAYLGGSAFLDWLERHTGEGSLDRLWRRMTARRGRSFEAAFRGVFGDGPASLWDRFAAELAWQAIEVERRLGSDRREGEPWLDRDWGTGAPAVSRDGGRLVVALAARDRPLRLAVYDTAVDAAPAARRREERHRLLVRDPEDVAAVAGGAPARIPLATLELPGTTVEPTPRFLADGSLLFARSLPDAGGRYRSDLFRWWPHEGRVARVTRGADLRAADPAPDGRWAVAVESRWGQTRLVRVELANGAVTPWGEPSVEAVVDAPRIDPDGRRLAYLRHAEAGWALVVRELASGEERVVPTPSGATLEGPAWAPTGDALYATVEEDGLLDVQRLPLTVNQAATRVTRTTGAALAPAPTPGGDAIFFLALEPEGMQVRRLELAPVAAETPEAPLAPEEAADARRAPASPETAILPASTASRPPGDPTTRPLSAAELYPALPPPPGPLPPPLERTPVPASRDYGRGRGEWSPLAGGNSGAAGSSFELGARGGDLVGRWDLLALGALSSAGGTRGAAVAGTWRGWPLALAAHLYATREEVSAQRRPAHAVGDALDLHARGGELSAGWERAWLGGGGSLHGAAGAETLAPERGATLHRRSVQLAVNAGRELRHGPWRAGGALDLDGQLGTTADRHWSRRDERLRLDLGRGDTSIDLRWERQQEGGEPTVVDLLRVGGLPTSLLPPLATAQRILDPALPEAALLGERYEGQRVALALPGLALVPFWARHRVGDGAGWEPWLALAGLDLELDLPPLPLLDLPAARLRLGVARLLDAPYRGDVDGWVALAWRP